MRFLYNLEKSTYEAFVKQFSEILEKSGGKKIAIWGAGVRGIVAGMVLEELNIRDYVYIDSDPMKRGKKIENNQILSFTEVEIEKYVIVLSMEYPEEVIDYLSGQKLKKNEDFFCLIASEESNLLNKLMYHLEKKCLILGGSVVNNVPFDEIQEPDLAECLEKADIDIKALGVSNLSMEMMYYLIEFELFVNHFCEEIVILVDFKEFTTYHSELPRTQKPSMLRNLRKLAEMTGNESLVNQINNVYDAKVVRSENFLLENAYSPNRLEDNQEKRVQQYLSLSVKDSLSKNCDEIEYLIKILELVTSKNKKIKIIIQPMNPEYCRELCGKEFEKSYYEKKSLLQEIVDKNGGICIDAGNLLDRSCFITYNSPNDVIRYDGRVYFAKYICEIVKENGNV